MSRITMRELMPSLTWPPFVALLALAAVLMLAPFVLCQDEAPAPPPPAKAEDAESQPQATNENEQAEEKAADEEEDIVHVENADHMRYDAEKGIYFLTDNVHFRHKDAHLYCDEAQYDEENDTARAVGHLKLVTPDTTVTGDLITADFDEEVADIAGNVRLITQRKKAVEAEQEGAETPEGAEPKQEEAEAEEGDEKPKKLDEYREKLTTVTCEKIRYWYEEKRAVATGNIVAVQEDKTCYADEGTYLEEEDTLTLIGSPVRVVMENGNRFQAAKVRVDVGSDRIWTEEGPFTGFFKREKKEEEGQEQPAAAPAEEQPATEAETPPPPE